jgi:flagellar protein FlgJ
MDPLAALGLPGITPDVRRAAHASLTPPTSKATGSGPATKAEDPAQGFEAIFMRQLLRDMRKTASFDGESSSMTGLYTDMLDDVLAEHLTKAGGLGLAGVIRAYLERSGR